MSKLYDACNNASNAKVKLIKSIAKQIELACKSKDPDDLTPIISALITHDDLEAISLFKALRERFEKQVVRESKSAKIELELDTCRK
jgi:hypothetical protein